MATITFLGAAQEVTGSCHLLESPAVGRVLIDCGMHQGGDAVERIQDEHFEFDPASIDAVLLSHAHLDHSGLLPRLYHEGFRGSIHCTRATAELLDVMLHDSVGLYLRDLERTNIRNARRGRPTRSGSSSFSRLSIGPGLPLPGLSARTQPATAHFNGLCCLVA